MKRFLYCLISLTSPFALLSDPAMSAQTPRAPKSGTPHVVASDAYLDQAVATVETSKITRRDVVLAYLDYTAVAPPTPRQPGTSASNNAARAEIGDIAPQLFHGGPKLSVHNSATAGRLPAPSDADLHRVAQRIFTGDNRDAASMVETLMRQRALEVAAQQRHLQVTDAELTQGVHIVLGNLRTSRELPSIPGETDRQLAQRIGTSYGLQYRSVRERLLTRALVISDLSDQLGHTPQVNDFYRAHLIVIPVEKAKSSDADWERARSNAAQLGADLVEHKQEFEAAARRVSDDQSSRRGGDTGPLVRTLLPAEMEQALSQLKPGEVSAPIRGRRGYLLLRLDKRGAEMTEQERQAALEICYIAPKRRNNALARVLKNITWSTSIGAAPEWFRDSVSK